MTIEVVLLALASTVRPTSLAAVYALLASGSPRRLMIAYVATGLAFTVGFGLLVIWTFSGVDFSAGADRTKAIAEIAAGALSLGFAGLVLFGRVGGSHPSDAPKAPHRWDGLLERHLTLRTAALAGPATHIPGLFYLLALNVIIGHQPVLAVGLVEVVIFNAIWFALPITALAICIVRPPTARHAIQELERWASRHTRTILLVASLGAGGVLLVRGLLTI